MEKEIKHIAECLCVSCGKVTVEKDTKIPTLQGNNGTKIRGLTSISKYLAQKSQLKDVLGRSPFDRAVVDQWLEFRALQVANISQEKEQQIVLQELNNHLSDRVFLAGFYLTIADITLYLGLHPIMNDLTFYEKQQYLNLSRWFDEVQHSKEIRHPKLKAVFFQKNLIYSKGSSH